MNYELDAKLEQIIAQLRKDQMPVTWDELRNYAFAYIWEEYQGYIVTGLNEEQFKMLPIKFRGNLREMGCDGGFEPISPEFIELDSSLSLLERFTALLRAALQFYTFKGPVERAGKKMEGKIRVGFLILDGRGFEYSEYFGLHQDMVRYLTDQVCVELGLGIQLWMQRGNSSHIRQLVDNNSIGEILLLDSFLGFSFEEFYAAMNTGLRGGLFEELAALSDEIDNAHFARFPDSIISSLEQQYSRLTRSIPWSPY